MHTKASSRSTIKTSWLQATNHKQTKTQRTASDLQAIKQPSNPNSCNKMVKYNTLPTSEQNTPSDKAANTEKTNKKGTWKKAKKAIKQFILGDYNTGSRHQYMYPVIYGIGGHY